MKKIVLSVALATVIATSLAFMPANSNNVMRREGKTYIVNTTTLCKQRGFRGPTPLEVYIKGNKVTKVVPLKNQETPQYFSKVVKGLLPKIAGKNTSKASTVDGVTGATYSSRAVKANVAAAVKYYQSHK